MPNFFQLIKKTDGQAETLVAVDEALCRMANVDPDPQVYYMGWVDTVGLLLACGRPWEEIRKTYEGSALEEVCAFLQMHYDVRAWYVRG